MPLVLCSNRQSRTVSAVASTARMPADELSWQLRNTMPSMV